MAERQFVKKDKEWILQEDNDRVEAGKCYRLV